MTALSFRLRQDRVDSIIQEAALRQNQFADTLERAVNESAVPFVDLIPEENTLPRHYGRVARALWHVSDAVFKAADHPEDCPPGFHAKSVQISDVFEPPYLSSTQTSFLTLSASSSEPILVACPVIPEQLLEPLDGDKLGKTRELLSEYVRSMCERLNLVAPVALLLAKSGTAKG